MENLPQLSFQVSEELEELVGNCMHGWGLSLMGLWGKFFCFTGQCSVLTLGGSFMLMSFSTEDDPGCL